MTSNANRNSNGRLCCPLLEAQLHHEDRLVLFRASLREYALTVQDGGESGVVIQFCPWCGTSFPSSLRDEWYDALEELGIDPATDEVPAAFKTDEWWRGAKTDS